MRKIICTMFGCRWRYFFTLSDSYIQRVDIRTCTCCHNTQQYKKVPSGYSDTEFVWMNMVGYTKLGAEKHWTVKAGAQKV